MRYVRVSEILARLQSYADIDPEVLEAKALIGTNVHQAIVQDCADEFVVFDTDRARAYFESYKLWDVRKPNITQIPRLYCDKLMITGECDGLWDAGDPYLPKLVDWKCSASPSLKIWNMQAHFYWYLLKQNGYVISDSMFWINLRHTKRYKKDPETNIGYTLYDALTPVVHEFKFDPNVLSQCIDEAHKYWEEYNDAKVLV